MIPGTNCSLSDAGAVNLLGKPQLCTAKPSSGNNKTPSYWWAYLIVGLAVVICLGSLIGAAIIIYRGYRRYSGLDAPEGLFRLSSDDDEDSLVR